jgi:hypothetical protein
LHVGEFPDELALRIDFANRPLAFVAGEEVAVADVAPEDDIVLEREPDDADVSGLVDVDIEEPKER